MRQPSKSPRRTSKRAAAVTSRADDHRSAGRQQAEVIASALEAIPLNQSNAASIAKGEEALHLLKEEAGSELWFQLQLRLGNMLLESREGNQAENYDRAKAHYRTALEHALSGPSVAVAMMATSGLANALSWDPRAGREDFESAFKLYEGLLSHYRRVGDLDSLASVLGNYSLAKTKAAKLWDAVDALEKAFLLSQEAARVRLSEPDARTRNPRAVGRSLHNLGVAYMERPRGVRSQNVDFAVKSFQEALKIRTIEDDPLGRVKTLRAIALAYPEWIGADSLAHGAALAEEARAEAEWIVNNDTRAVQRMHGWAAFAGQRSALSADLDWLDGQTELPQSWFKEAIANHQQALEVIPREATPAQWAEWAGGLARVLGKLTRFDKRYLPQAYQWFGAALAVVDRSNHIRLWREIQRRFGELAHEIGDWATTAGAYGAALDATDQLFDASGTPDARDSELADSRAFALFASNAAARTGDREAAVRFAEHGRSRTLVDVISAADAMLAAAPADLRAKAVEMRDRVARLEQSLREVEHRGATAEMNEIRAKLVDFLMVDPNVLKVRSTTLGALDEQAQNEEYARISGELVQARGELRQALATVRGGSPAAPNALGASDVVEIARSAGYPIVYLLATAYGSLAIIAPPDGSIQLLEAPNLTSADTRALADGNEDRPGFLRAMAGDEDALASAIEPCLDKLRSELMSSLSAWLRTHGFDRAALAPLGSIGLLPVHAAGPADGPSLGYVPSARALSLGLALRQRSNSPTSRLAVVAEPVRTDTEKLPLAMIEARAISGRFPSPETTAMLSGSQATAAALRAELGHATHVHFACHGVFRPSDPRASALLLAGDDRMTLGQVFDREWPLSNVKLAVLSACQTAVNEFRRVPDESVGFPSAMLLAGIPGIVGTMWPVDDTATTLFCDRFYELYCGGREPAAAVSEAQRWLAELRPGEATTRATELRRRIGQDGELFEREVARWCRGAGSDDRPFASPDLWAGFCYVGA